MLALVAIFAIFAASALGLIALIWYALRQRALQAPAPSKPKKLKRRKAAQDTAQPEPEPLPLKTGRSRLISAASLAEAEAANSAPESVPVEPAAPGPEPVPLAPEPEQPSPLAAAARQAVVFRQHFPPHLGAESRSFFGGTPHVPGTLEWPRDPETDKPLHFILQVDLAAVPDEARLGLLPDSGVLAVFLDLQWGAGDAFRVVWQQGYEGMPWRELSPPHDLAAAYGDEGAYVWPWALTPQHGIPLLPRWPFEPVRIAVPELPEDFEEETGSPPSWSGSDEVAQALLAAQGSEAESFPEPLSPQDFLSADGETLVAPWPGFPQDWLAIQTTSAALVRAADRALRMPRASLYPELDDMARAAHVATVREEAQAWFDHALGNPALGPVAPPVRKAFWDWFAGHKPLAQLVASGAVEAAVETTLHAAPEEAANFPPEITAKVAARHALAHVYQGRINAPTPDRMLAPFSDVQGGEQEIAATHLLLLELSSNEGIGHRFGEGVYQFWITPEDLADRRFEQVVLTRAAY